MEISWSLVFRRLGFVWLVGGRSEANSGHFVEVCRRGLKVNAGKNKVMVLGREERLER